MNDKLLPDNSMNLLNGIVGNTIEDMLVPSPELKMVETKPQVYTASAFCLVFQDGKRIYFSITEQVIKGEDYFSVEVLDNFVLCEYPGGPSFDWVSISNKFIKEDTMIVSAVNILSLINSNSNNCLNGLIDGVILHTMDDQNYCFLPSSVPSWIDLIYNNDYVINTIVNSNSKIVIFPLV